MQPNKPYRKRFRSALLLAVAFVLIAAATAAGASGWVASARDSVEEFLQRDEFRALAAVLTTTQPESEPTTPAPQPAPANLTQANLTQASLCWWQTFTR